MKILSFTIASALSLWSCQNGAPGEEAAQHEPLAENCNCRAPGAKPSADGETLDLSRVDLTQSPSRGSAEAAVTLVVFTDFECPFCKRVQTTLSELERIYGQDLRIVVKQLPLAFHPQARLAAIATFAAEEQGRFWPFHDALFATKTTPDRAELVRIAGEVGLDVAKFESSLESPDLARRVDRDLADAAALGITGTPTCLVNGKKISGAQRIEEFQRVIDEALENGG